MQSWQYLLFYTFTVKLLYFARAELFKRICFCPPVGARVRFCALWNRGLELDMFFITCLLSTAVLATDDQRRDSESFII